MKSVAMHALLVLPVGFSLLGLASPAIAQQANDLAVIPTNLAGVVAYAQPPSGFDPAAVSDTELARYGFPPRPDRQSAPRAYERWQKLVSLPRLEHPQLVQTNLRNTPASLASEPKASTANGSTQTTSSNWSGYVLSAANGTFVANNETIDADYMVPLARAAYLCGSDGWNHTSIWAGFDGWGSNDVLQGGDRSRCAMLGWQRNLVLRMV